PGFLPPPARPRLLGALPLAEPAQLLLLLAVLLLLGAAPRVLLGLQHGGRVHLLAPRLGLGLDLLLGVLGSLGLRRLLLGLERRELLLELLHAVHGRHRFRAQRGGHRSGRRRRRTRAAREEPAHAAREYHHRRRPHHQ